MTAMPTDIRIPFTFSHEALPIELDLVVAVDIAGNPANDDCVSWSIDSIGIARWDTFQKREVIRWLSDLDDFVIAIIKRLKGSTEFDDAVREAAIEQAEAA